MDRFGTNLCQTSSLFHPGGLAHFGPTTQSHRRTVGVDDCLPRKILVPSPPSAGTGNGDQTRTGGCGAHQNRFEVGSTLAVAVGITAVFGNTLVVAASITAVVGSTLGELLADCQNSSNYKRIADEVKLTTCPELRAASPRIGLVNFRLAIGDR